MSKLFFIPLLLIVSLFVKAQNVGIGTTNPKASAALEISSPNKGLLIPRTSSTDRTGIAAPAKGLMVYDTTHSAFFYYDGGKWRPLYEKNYDSASIDYYNVSGAIVNLPTSVSGGSVDAIGNSGFIYDNGGPTGNYSANNLSYARIVIDDSTLQIKITVEEMNAETFYDSLFIIQLNGTGYLDTLAGFSGTQTGTVTANNSVRIYFKANNINHLAGFKIRWGRLRSSGALQTPTPLYGWNFNNAKLAAMGGLQQNNNWHKDSVGFGSLSYGIDVKAKGKHSFAVGYNLSAIGDFSTAMGSLTKANGDRSTALGYGTNANGRASTSMGNFSKALGDFSTAMGINTQAIGDASNAMGDNTKASGQSSTAMGSYTYANGNYSTAIGYVAEANGSGSISLGTDTKANGDKSIAMGNQSIANGDFSTALGNETEAKADASTAMGNLTIANGEISTAMGSNTQANGRISVATGLSTYANGYASFVTGMYNDSILTRQNSSTSTTPLFIIGNGNPGTRSNAMVVLKNGNVAIGDNGSPVSRLHITGGSDLDLTDNSGFMTLGGVGGSNMVVDNNEIQVRNNGAVSNLFIQSLGGDVRLANNATGQVMIGTGSPDQRLSVNGNASKVGGGSWVGYSDIRLKQNVSPYTDGLATLLKIKPVWYNYNQASGFDVSKKYIGVLAQELQTISPYMVTESQNNKAADGSGYLSVDNSAMTYMLINAVKEQQQQIEKLKTEIELLKAKK